MAGVAPDAMIRQEQSRHAALWAPTDLDARVAAALGAQGAAYLAYRAAWHDTYAVRAHPLQIDFELNHSCNMRCPMCTYALPESEMAGKQTWLPLDRFRDLLAEARDLGVVAVGLNGVNEPLIRSDLPDFVHAARAAGMLDVMLHTNGMLLTDRMARGLIDAGLTKLLVSLDAVSQPVYDQIRVGGDLARVERNIHTFLAQRGAAPLPLLGLCFVRMTVNAHELPAFLLRWEGLADFFAIQEYMRPDAGLRDLHDPTRQPAQAFRCGQPFQRLRVSLDGTVHPCCAFYGDDIAVGHVGNGLRDAWMRAGNFRTLHAAGRGREHAVCRACIDNSYTEPAAP